MPHAINRKDWSNLTNKPILQILITPNPPPFFYPTSTPIHATSIPHYHEPYGPPTKSSTVKFAAQIRYKQQRASQPTTLYRLPRLDSNCQIASLYMSLANPDISFILGAVHFNYQQSCVALEKKLLHSLQQWHHCAHHRHIIMIPSKCISTMGVQQGCAHW